MGSGDGDSGEGTSQQGVAVCIRKAAKRQCSLGEMVSASQKKNELISDLITIFAVANIPLPKVDMPYATVFRKHVNNGGSIPGSSQLRETYLPRLLPDIESAVEKMMKDISSLNIILDETTDNTSSRPGHSV